MHNLDTMLDWAVERAAETLRGKKELLPTWLSESADGVRHVHVTPFRDVTEKDLTAALMRQLFASLNVIRFVYICEAWVAVASVGGDVTTPPSQRADRQDAVLFIAEDDAGGQRTRVYPVIQHPHHRELGKPETTDGGMMEGRFVNMLPIRRGKQ